MSSFLDKILGPLRKKGSLPLSTTERLKDSNNGSLQVHSVNELPVISDANGSGYLFHLVTDIDDTRLTASSKDDNKAAQMLPVKVRMLMYRECEKRGRKCLYDSHMTEKNKHATNVATVRMTKDSIKELKDLSEYVFGCVPLKTYGKSKEHFCSKASNAQKRFFRWESDYRSERTCKCNPTCSNSSCSQWKTEASSGYINRVHSAPSTGESVSCPKQDLSNRRNSTSAKLKRSLQKPSSYVWSSTFHVSSVDTIASDNTYYRARSRSESNYNSSKKASKFSSSSSFSSGYQTEPKGEASLHLEYCGSASLKSISLNSISSIECSSPNKAVCNSGNRSKTSLLNHNSGQSSDSLDSSDVESLIKSSNPTETIERCLSNGKQGSLKLCENTILAIVLVLEPQYDETLYSFPKSMAITELSPLIEESIDMCQEIAATAYSAVCNRRASQSIRRFHQILIDFSHLLCHDINHWLQNSNLISIPHVSPLWPKFTGFNRNQTEAICDLLFYIIYSRKKSNSLNTKYNIAIQANVGRKGQAEVKALMYLLKIAIFNRDCRHGHLFNTGRRKSSCSSVEEIAEEATPEPYIQGVIEHVGKKIKGYDFETVPPKLGTTKRDSGIGQSVTSNMSRCHTTAANLCVPSGGMKKSHSSKGMILSEIQENWTTKSLDENLDKRCESTGHLLQEKVSFHLGEFGNEQSISNLELSQPVPFLEKVIQEKNSTISMTKKGLKFTDEKCYAENSTEGKSALPAKEVSLRWLELEALISRERNDENSPFLGNKKLGGLASGCLCGNIYINDSCFYNPFFKIQIVFKGDINFDPIHLEARHRAIFYLNLDKGYTRTFNFPKWEELVKSEETEYANVVIKRKRLMAFVDGLIQICQIDKSFDRVKEFVQIHMTEFCW